MTGIAPAEFGCRSARSGSLTLGLALAVAVETVVLHLWLHARHPVTAWALTCLSVATIAWLAADYRSMGRSAVMVDGDRLDIRVGRRARAVIPVEAIADVLRPTWKDLPQAGAAAAREYRNLTKPADPNVLIVLREAAPLLLAQLVRLPVRRIGLHLDDPDAFTAAIGAVRSGGMRATGIAPRRSPTIA